MATYIGLDLGGTNIKISVFDDFFHKLGEKRTPTEVRFGSEHVLNRIYDAVLALLDELHLTCQDITCMGIGVPGILDIKNGISRFSPNFPKWEEVQSSPGWRAIFISRPISIMMHVSISMGNGNSEPVKTAITS